MSFIYITLLLLGVAFFANGLIFFGGVCLASSFFIHFLDGQD